MSPAGVPDAESHWIWSWRIARGECISREVFTRDLSTLTSWIVTLPDPLLLTRRWLRGLYCPWAQREAGRTLRGDQIAQQYLHRGLTSVARILFGISSRFE
jgi:hypothetical protein